MNNHPNNMTDIEILSNRIQEWKAVNVFCKPSRIFVPYDMWLRIVNLPFWKAEKWAQMLMGKQHLILFGYKIEHRGCYDENKYIEIA